MSTLRSKSASGRRFRFESAFGLTWILLTAFLLSGCDSAGDPQRIAAQARAVKGLAADATNSLLLLVTTFELQVGVQQAAEHGANLATEHPAAQTLTGFQSLAPSLIGRSEAFRLARPVRGKINAGVARAKKELAEIEADMPGLSAALSSAAASLGGSAKALDSARADLASSVKILADLVAQATTYGEAADGYEANVNAMLRELDALTRAATIQEQKATIVRLNAFADNMLSEGKKLMAALQSEASAKNAGLGLLLKCFRNLDSVAGLPEDLSREIREAIKVLDDVSKGGSFSAKPQ